MAVCVPPLAFLATIAIARRRAGYERIVFYQALCACLVCSALGAWIAGADIARMVDVVTVGIGVFLTLGRVGCFRVACCHGRPWRWGVRYGRAHVVVGFPAFWEGRPVVPVQLIEAAASLVLAGAAAAAIALGEPGDAATLYVVGYAVVRFHLELVRGDRDRRYTRGLSEAQWMALATCIVAAALHRGVATWLATAALWIIASVRITTRSQTRHVLLRAGHIHELEALQRQLGVAMSGRTSEGLAVTRHILPDGRTDFVWSREAGLPVEDARRLALAIDPCAEIVTGRVAGLIHVVIPGSGTA
ncbi:MAG TPA: prolipoprotein diacylglyceryl transferase family protein [Kofleriaceae bacterium]|nr:prolipoprotein diacylglyceryl transferase family protein [Kofleriaceae bacterium]